MHTVVVGADLERLVPPHHQPGLAVFLVLQQLDIPGTALLPLLRISIEFEQLSTPINTRLAPDLSLSATATYILKVCSSCSSCVLTSAFSRWTRGSK
jgi:hypothetical protein